MLSDCNQITPNRGRRPRMTGSKPGSIHRIGLMQPCSSSNHQLPTLGPQTPDVPLRKTDFFFPNTKSFPTSHSSSTLGASCPSECRKPPASKHLSVHLEDRLPSKSMALENHPAEEDIFNFLKLRNFQLDPQDLNHLLDNAIPNEEFRSQDEKEQIRRLKNLLTKAGAVANERNQKVTFDKAQWSTEPKFLQAVVDEYEAVEDVDGNGEDGEGSDGNEEDGEQGEDDEEEEQQGEDDEDEGDQGEDDTPRKSQLSDGTSSEALQDTQVFGKDTIPAFALPSLQSVSQKSHARSGGFRVNKNSLSIGELALVGPKQGDTEGARNKVVTFKALEGGEKNRVESSKAFLQEENQALKCEKMISDELVRAMGQEQSQLQAKIDALKLGSLVTIQFKEAYERAMKTIKALERKLAFLEEQNKKLEKKNLVLNAQKQALKTDDCKLADEAWVLVEQDSSSSVRKN
ncbi:hypothetical protein CERZMDRAFT_88089 [Cercospora zeae-maydis SCOH1-5]|uniref:Uncharacterized protein n=1 Tax=Cercospora zeae-maydis SCOH1-5 TaxID=717836 RepID=A0A6A6F3G7_9PEZI|nr:hypothetical protein CERZMDRAFT_88089 [Cercospora zeae-maydis SCOH1-5]